jgi:hypothetical protein
MEMSTERADERAGEGARVQIQDDRGRAGGTTETVEDAIYPAMPGGYKTLVTLPHE